MSNVYINGVGMTRFGRQPHRRAPELGQEAILSALNDAEMGVDDIQAVYCANVFGGMVLGQVIVRDLRMRGIPVYNVENACASGATAVNLARHALIAQQYTDVLVLGIEQLTQLGGGTIPMQRNDDMTDLYANSGMVLPAVYAMRATRFLQEGRGTLEDLANIVTKNRHHGMLNELAQQRQEVSVEEVLGSRPVADPLTLLQCCPSQVDGAASLVLSSKPRGTKPVKVLASIVRSGIGECAGDDLLEAEITATAARLAYDEAGVSPEDVGIVELHDAFSIAELIYYEALGLARVGDATALLRSGQTRIGGRIPVNPSGGLLAKGHPLGATGVAQMVEVAWHLQGRAGARQSGTPRIGITQCTGGGIAGVDHAASSVHVLAV